MNDKQKKDAADKLRGKLSGETKQPAAKASPAAVGDGLDKYIPKPPAENIVDAWYETTNGKFYVSNARGEYMRVDKETLALELRAAGFYTSYRHENGLTYLEGEMLRLTKHRTVNYAGPLAGFMPQVRKMGTSNVLVTEGPEFIDPKPGEWPFLRLFLTQLLGDQARYYCAWLKWALMSLKKGPPWSPGQLFAIAGGTGCGKSFLQSLTTEVLGKRFSKPYKYLAGKKEFSSTIMEAEHGLIGDETAFTDIRFRRALGSSLKNLIANKEQDVEAKFKSAKGLTPFLRLTMSMNDNHAGLMALPPLDRDVTDKVILVKATPVKFPWPSKKFPDSQAYWQKLVSELPHFLFYLRRWPIPESIRCQRYGVISFKNEELLDEMDSLSPEFKLWTLIEELIFGDDEHKVWEGGSTQLDRELKKADRTGDVQRLLYYDTACGQYLSKLVEKTPLKVASKKVGKKKILFRLSCQDNNTPYINKILSE